MNENQTENVGASWNVKLVKLPPREFFESKLKYIPETGQLIWKSHRILVGKEVGCKQFRSNGIPNAIRVCMKVGGKQVHYVAHRIAFVLMGVTVPVGMVIDHIDGDPFNNRWSNLRVVSHSQNITHQKRRSQNPSGLPPHVIRGPWGLFVQVTINKKRHCVHGLPTVEAAIAVRDDLIKRLHGEFSAL